MRRLAPPLALAVLLTGCGYFNSLYNANRHFADAERARRRGEVTARTSYHESIEKAAVSYRKHPDGRWADDALLLIGRAHFALAQDAEAVAALRRVLALTSDDDMAAVAHTYLGAALVRLDRLDSAVIHLDHATDRQSARSEMGSFGRLWRARAAFQQDRVPAAWQDLDAVLGATGPHVVDIALETARRAVEHGDTLRFTAALERLAAVRDARRVDDVQAVMTAAARRWSPSQVFRLGTPLERTAWSAHATDRMTLFRAQLAVEAGDTATGIALGTRVAESVRGGNGSAARLIVARLRLATLTDAAELEGVRALLLPAFDLAEALQLQRTIRAGQILIERGASASTALSLFAAAELARDELAAPRLARTLFLEFANVGAATPWSGKALLAAAALAPGADTDAAIAALSANLYVRTARGEATGDDFMLAEQRLARGLDGLRADASAEAIARDVVVGRAVAVLDSSRAVARSDSMRIVCGTFIDSVRVTGIRADSTRSACLRGDSVRVAFVLRADTTELVDSATARRQKTAQPGRPGAVRPDTSLVPRL